MCDISTIPITGIREPFSSLSHALGACVFAVLSIMLIRRGRGDRLRMIGLSLMAFASLQTLLLSTVYHMQWPGPMREFMLRADVAGIFVLIAGCYTPVQIILFQGLERWVPLAVAWTAAILGMTLRLIYFDDLPNVAGIGAFLLFGWGGAVTAIIVWQKHGWTFVRDAVLAGLSYTVGAIVLLNHAPTLIHGVIGPHELWHLAVLTGLGMHWRFVFQIVASHASAENLLGLPPERPQSDAELVTVKLPKTRTMRDAA